MPAGIKQIPAGKEYKPSAEREQRDMLRAFMARPELVD
jgi:hypothetical protein